MKYTKDQLLGTLAQYNLELSSFLLDIQEKEKRPVTIVDIAGFFEKFQTKVSNGVQVPDGMPPADMIKKWVEQGFEDELNGETIEEDSMEITILEDAVEYSFDIYDTHREATMGNSLRIYKDGRCKFSLHEAYEGGGVESYVETQIEAWFI